MKHNWEYRKFGSLCNIVRGGSPRPIQDYITDAADGLNWIKIGDVAAGSKYITSTKEKIKKEGLRKTRQVFKGDFILSNSMSFGRPYILKIDGCIHDGWLAIKDVENYFVADFLYYYLSSPSTYSIVKKLVKGGVVSNLNSDIVKGIDVPVPSMEVQQQIVAELDKINDIIEDCRKLLCYLDNLAQSLFYDYFGDPVTNPKGWYLDVWSNLFDTILGKMLDKAKQDPNDKSIPYLANQNVQWGYFNLTNLNEMTFSNQEIEKFKLRIGDILICEGGESGRCAIWEDALSLILFQKAIHRARIKDRTKLNPYFIRFWLENLKKNDGLKNYITKATIEHLTGAKLKTVKVPVPPLELQEKFAERIEQIDAQKKTVEETIANLQTLLDSRMDYWFND